MKYLLLILSTSILLAGELEVDGNLKVTGTVESVTIDSLKAVIADLQAQLAALQDSNAIKYQIYDVTFENSMGHDFIYPEINLNDLTGFNLDFSIIKIISINSFECLSGNCSVGILRGNADTYKAGHIRYAMNRNNNTGFPYYEANSSSNNNTEIILYGNNARIWFDTEGIDVLISLKLLITAQFPN